MAGTLHRTLFMIGVSLVLAWSNSWKGLRNFPRSKSWITACLSDGVNALGRSAWGYCAPNALHPWLEAGLTIRQTRSLILLSPPIHIAVARRELVTLGAAAIEYRIKKYNITALLAIPWIYNTHKASHI